MSVDLLTDLPAEVQAALAESTRELVTALQNAWRPRPRLTVSQIAERHLVLSTEYTKAPGPIRFGQRPHLREIMNRLTPDDPVRTVAYRSSIQDGKTVIGQAFVTAAIGYYPGAILWVTDTAGKAAEFSKKRLDRMIRDSPLLRALVAEAKGGRSRDNTITLKVFPGGDIKIVGAQSVSGLTSDTIRYVIIDEADDHRANVSKAGSSIALAMGRQTDFEDIRKTLIVSSPKVAGESDIDAWHDRGDQRRFHVPCIRCGELQPMRWRDPDTKEHRLIWSPGHPDEAHYVCAFCGAAWENNDKAKFMPAGAWLAHRPDLGENGTITSYSSNALYAPIGGFSWVDFARQWESAMARAKAGDHDELRTVINQRVAESFATPGEQLDAHALTHLVEPDWGERIPEGVLVIVTGTDVHPNRKETMTLGIGLGWEMWLLDYAVDFASPLDTTGWARLDEVLERDWMTDDGRELSRAAGCVDARFCTQRVLEFCRTRLRRRVFAVMGDTGAGAIWPRKVSLAGKNKDKGAFFPVKVDTAKNDLYEHLQITKPGPKYLHIPDRLRGEFPDLLDQLTAERRIKNKDGHWAWEKKAGHLRNEVWDTLVYCLAAAHSLVMGGLRLDMPHEAERRAPIVRRGQSVDRDPEPRHPEGAELPDRPAVAPADDFWSNREG